VDFAIGAETGSWSAYNFFRMASGTYCLESKGGVIFHGLLSGGKAVS